jgi:hypothetical protein
MIEAFGWARGSRDVVVQGALADEVVGYEPTARYFGEVAHPLDRGRPRKTWLALQARFSAVSALPLRLTG